MAAYDIMPFRSSHGGHIGIRTYQLAASQTFNQGELVKDDGAGRLALATVVSPDVTLATEAVGIASEPAQGMATSATGVTNAVDSPRGIYPFDRDVEFITSNYSQGGAAFGDSAPVQTNVGETVGLTVIGGVWGVELVGSAQEQFTITQVLDANKNPVTSGNGTYVVFQKTV